MLNKNTPILIIGYGSIGKRHYQNLRKLNFDNVYVFDIDKKKIYKERVKEVKKINKQTLKKFPIVFICNPTNLHIVTAIRCVQAGCYLFIEKPLSHNLKSISKLKKICNNKRIINMIACNMRFHPCFYFIKKYLEKNKLGKLYSLSLEFGYWLPYWRPNQSYQKSYAVQKDTGGGIILDDIHEFDLLFWLNNFQEVLESKFVFQKVSDLKIDTEDICLASFRFKNKTLGLVKCDYLQQSYSRTCKIVGEKGNLVWDFNENIVWLYTKEKRHQLFKVKNYNINNMYIEEIKYFLNCVEKQQPTFNDIKIAAATLKYCLNR